MKIKKKPVIQTKYKQSYIAKRLGVSQPTVSNWLNLAVKPTGLGRVALESKYPEIMRRIEEEWEKKEIQEAE